MIPTQRPIRLAAIGTAAFLLLAVGGCGTPQSSLAAHEVATSDALLAEAVRLEAARVAPVEVVNAHAELDAAKRALNDYDYETATLLANEAEADAMLAESKARNATAQANVQALQENVRALRAELNRSQ